jgi:hypothetical protein
MIAPRWSAASGLESRFEVEAEARSVNDGFTSAIGGPGERLADSQDTAPLPNARTLWLRTLFLLDVFGAGVPGVLLLVSPRIAGEWLFGTPIARDDISNLLGSVWLGLGIAALGGVFRPLTFSPLLLMQMIYKSIWLCAVAVPALWSSRGGSPLLTVVFAGWVVVVGLALPWRNLLPCRAPARSG